VGDVLRALICDDSPGFPTLVRTWLRADGRFEVVGLAKSGEQAKHMASELGPDVIALDLVLPDVADPATLVAELRALHPPLRIMIVSSLHTGALESATAAAGADGCCEKSATAAVLTERLYSIGVADGSSTQKLLP
jgi:DNA-binding NarL/FixJ family response regulator